MWAKAIRAARKRMGLTQVQTATLLGVRQATVSDWEKAKYEPSDDVKPIVIARMGIDPKDVVPDWLRPVLIEQPKKGAA